MSADPLLTIEDLAAVLKVAPEMAREWESEGLLPVEEDADTASGRKYRQRRVVVALRERPEIMAEIKKAMMAKRGISSDDKSSG
ncbi:MAG: hypothetical protein DWQ31_09890 [Planctomycetota bacterium]|nr:MAG: hypothetical protein DWQ31_09890 [Planctomycetota bacterium]REJ96835.1 MAG: hypothetical protein DWQ35_03480 [Planctomycetota bacterium]REK24024.1 MAG: hypothetical protein DWQ42_13795 [Planctomycetota bacterium]REK39355.1 MAG: hypothetical protein DWQ46_18950 [Planctomycetota bacterium]